MPTEIVSLESLHRLNGGRPAGWFDGLVRRAHEDCYDRPQIEKPRKVTLTIEFTPIVREGGDGGCAAIASNVEVSAKGPSHKTTTATLMRTVKGDLVFDPEAADPQMTLVDEAIHQTCEEMDGTTLADGTKVSVTAGPRETR